MTNPELLVTGRHLMPALRAGMSPLARALVLLADRPVGFDDLVQVWWTGAEQAAGGLRVRRGPLPVGPSAVLVAAAWNGELVNVFTSRPDAAPAVRRATALRNSAVRVSGSRVEGSGGVIGPRLVLTAAHVVDQPLSTVRVDGEPVFAAVTAAERGFDLDLALLWVPTLVAPALRVTQRNAPVNTEVVAAGNPVRHSTITYGRVSEVGPGWSASR